MAYGNALGRIDPDLTWTSVGPDDLASNTASVSGAVTAFAASRRCLPTRRLLDKDTNTSYLCRVRRVGQHGRAAGLPRQSTLVTALGSQGTGEPVHIDAWHGSVSIPFPNRAIQTLFVSGIGSVVNTPAGPTSASRTARLAGFRMHLHAEPRGLQPVQVLRR